MTEHAQLAESAPLSAGAEPALEPETPGPVHEPSPPPATNEQPWERFWRGFDRSRITPDHEYFVVDAVAHTYNQTRQNFRRPLGSVNGAYAFHEMTNPPESRLTPDQWEHDWQPEEFIDTMLLESQTDLVCMHSVPLFDYAVDGLVSNPKGAELKRLYPDRVVWYGALDLGEPQERVFALAEQLKAQGADGVKLYPTGTNHQTGKTVDWLMDDRQIAFPVLERVQALGFRHVAVHKLLEYEMYPEPRRRAYGINDMAAAARAFPGLTFHLVHAGWLLMENTILLLKEYPNITAVLEGPMLWPIIDQERFDLFLSYFLTAGLLDRLLYSSAATNPHPRWTIEAFARYEAPQNADFTLSHGDKNKIFGENFCRVHGIDMAKQRAATANDRFSRYKRERGMRRPWSAIAA